MDWYLAGTSATAYDPTRRRWYLLGREYLDRKRSPLLPA